jgi:hypothetical protein
MTIDAKGADRLMTLFVAAGMSLLMSAAMLLFNMGLTPDFWLVWMKNWVVSIAVAYPAALFVVPLARRVTSRLT